MQDNKENFLDSKTIIAIILLVVCWFGWDHYMKKKYPPQPISQFNQPVASKTVDEQLAHKTKLVFQENDYEETTLEFKGKNMEITFSSRGLGIKQLKLKNYYNRKNEPIVFDQPEQPLFSTWFFKREREVVPFELKRQGDSFVGIFSSSQGILKKTVTVDDSQYLLINIIEILPSTESKFKGLSLGFSYPLSEKKEHAGFFRMFFVYSQNLLKGFVFYDGKYSDRFDFETFEGNTSYPNLELAALGGKYFGKAFINNSPLLPSVVFKKTDRHVQARVDYTLLHSKPQNLEYKTFLGPKSLKNLQELGGEAQEWLDFGFFDWLARPLLLFLKWLYNSCGNWGWAIILLTFFVRLVLLPINMRSYKSMKVMQKIQPQMKELKEKHKSDPKKMNLEVMALMKKNKANPLGGCLPMFLQLPIFIALYRVFSESIELYQSPFVFWIKDLSLKDPYYIFPILSGLVFFVQQRITPMNLPKEQARLLTMIPLLFSVFMLNFPSGLTLYIFINGILGLVQQFFFVKLGQSHAKGGKNVEVV